MTLNVELLDTCLAWAEQEAVKPFGAWDQRDWSRETDCGTSYCIAGYAISLQPGLRFCRTTRGVAYAVLGAGYLFETGIGTVAADLLRIDRASADCLFEPSNTIEDIRQYVATLKAEGVLRPRGTDHWEVYSA